MNYLTAALQLVTLYGLYRLWTRKPVQFVTPDRTEEKKEIARRLDAYFKEGTERANVKPEPKEKQAPPPPYPQAVLEFAAGNPTHQRPLWMYSDKQLAMLCVNMRNYAKQRQAYNKGEGKRPKVRDVFPPAGSHLRQCLVPNVIEAEVYTAWRINGKWPVFLTHDNDKAVSFLRIKSKTG